MWLQLNKKISSPAFAPVLVNTDNIEEIEPNGGHNGCKIYFKSGRMTVVRENPDYFPVETLNSGIFAVRTETAIDGVSDEKVGEIVDKVILDHVRVPNSKMKQVLRKLADDMITEIKSDLIPKADNKVENKSKSNRMTTDALG